MVRVPAVAGQFYRADKEGLSKDLDNMIPADCEKVDAIAAVAPHAGYMCSGDVAGEVYARLKPKSTYIILSPNHTGYGSCFSASREPWETPLGEAEIDEDVLNAIEAQTSLIEEDPVAHKYEHSVEVQIPFIQKIAPQARVVPLTVSHGRMNEYVEVADAIYSAVKGTGADVTVISSSDMTHYESRAAAQEKDKLAIQKILDIDAEGLLDVVEKNGISMCGSIPTAIMLIYAKKMGAKKSVLVKYSDSGEVTGDTLQVVGYAGIIVS